MNESLLNKIICQRVLKTLPKIRERSIDTIITSPPYWKGFAYESYFNSYLQYLEWTEKWMEGIYRVQKDDGFFFLNITNDSETPVRAYELLNIATRKLYYKLHDTVIWYRYNSQPANTDRQLTNQIEFLFVLVKKSALVKFYKEQVSVVSAFDTKNIGNVWKIPFSSSKEKIFRKETESKFGHAGFPNELPRICIELTTKEEDVILDPFVGSGITCIEAKKLNRNYIGIDYEEDFCDIARKKLEKTKKGDLVKYKDTNLLNF